MSKLYHKNIYFSTLFADCGPYILKNNYKLNDTPYIERKGYKVNDLCFTVKNKKGLQGRKPSRQTFIFAIKSIKKGKMPPIFAIRNHNTDIFVSILWFLYGGQRWIRTYNWVAESLINKGFQRFQPTNNPRKLS